MRFIAIMLLVVVLDQASKFWIQQTFSLYDSMMIIPGLFSLTYLANTGAAFGMLAGHQVWWRQLLFIGVALVALTAITFLQRRLARDSFLYTVSLAMIGGGAVGNLIDRLRFGAVVDFLDFYIGSHHWPAFNVADSAISVGVGLFLIVQFVMERRKK